MQQAGVGQTFYSSINTLRPYQGYIMCLLCCVPAAAIIWFVMRQKTASINNLDSLHYFKIQTFVLTLLM